MDWLDTLLNLYTFAIVGLLVWLYLRDEKPDDGEDAGDRK